MYKMLSPNVRGTCVFHSQGLLHQDQHIFKVNGGIIHGSCVGTKMPNGSKILSESVSCECTAPDSAFHKNYFEIGALDGFYLSNTAFFDYQLGWRGLCVEATLAAFKELQKNRPNCINVHAVVGKSVVKDGARFFSFQEKNRDTNVIEGAEFNAGNGSRWEISMSCMEGSPGICLSLASAQAYAASSSFEVVIDHVDGVLLSDLFRRHKFDRIDFASIDVEGAEDFVVETINFEDTIFNRVIVEGTPEDHPGSTMMLRSAGYEVIKIDMHTIDTWWKPKHDVLAVDEKKIQTDSDRFQVDFFADKTGLGLLVFTCVVLCLVLIRKRSIKHCFQ